MTKTRSRLGATVLAAGTLLGAACVGDAASVTHAPPAEPAATEEFGMTEDEVDVAITSVEAAIGSCMQDRGFEYEPVPTDEVRALMDTIHTAEGLSEDEYLEQYGFGVTTQPFQQAGARVFGENAAAYEAMASEARAEYETALLGPDGDLPSPTFLWALDTENFSDTGGCTRAAVEDVFEVEQTSGAYINPVDESVQRDPLVVDASVVWSGCMNAAGHPSFDQEEAERDLRIRMASILRGRRDFGLLSPTEQQALVDLQDEERAAAAADRRCSEDHLDEVVTRVEERVTGVVPD